MNYTSKNKNISNTNSNKLDWDLIQLEMKNKLEQYDSNLSQ